MSKYISRQESTLGRRRSNIPSLVCAFSASATTGGTIYAFGIYGDAIKKTLGLTQLELDAISAMFFIAGLFSWIPGMVVDRMKMRFSMCLGGASGAIFTMTYWIICRQFVIVQHPVRVLSILAVLICLSCGLIVGSVFKLTMLCGGREGRGPAVGIAKGFVGLGSGIYATIFQAFRAPNQSALDFLPVIACFHLVCAALPALFLLPTKEQSHPRLMVIETTPLHFQILYGSLFVLFVFILFSSIADIYNSSAGEEQSQRNLGKVALLLILWLGPIVSLLFLPRKPETPVSTMTSISEESVRELEEEEEDLLSESIVSLEEDQSERPPPVVSKQEKKRILQSWRAVQEEEGDLASYQKGPPLRRNIVVDFRADLSLPEMLQTPSAWLMLWTTVILVGSGTAKTNNMGQMVESLGFEEAVTPATLAIFSVAQSAARILTGIVSESALKWKLWCGGGTGVPRPFFLVIASVISFLAHLMLMASTDLTWFVVGCTVSALAFGMVWPLMVLIVGDVFGIEHHGANYMFYDGGTKALGTILLSEYLTGSVYEAHVLPAVDGSSSETVESLCLGSACFRTTHMVLAGLALTCVIASYGLQYTSRHAYNKS